MTVLTRHDGYADLVLAGVAPDVMRKHLVTASEKYSAGGIYARVVDLPVDTALERGLKIEDDMHHELIRLDAYNIVSDAAKLTRLEGCAAVLVVSDDGNLRKELNTSNIGQIIGLKALAGSEVTKTDILYPKSNILKAGDPELYIVRTGNTSYEVHESRLVKLSGPTKTGYKRLPWEGRSLVEQPYSLIDDYFCALGYVLSIMRRKQQGIYRMSGLAEAIKMDLENLAKKRLEFIDNVRGITKTIAVDGEDEYTVRDLSVSGISQVMEEFEVAVSASSGIPVTILFGRTPGGVNSSATSEMSTLEGLAGNVRKTIMGPALHRIMGLISSQSYVNIQYDDPEAQWKPLSRPTEMDLSSITRANAQAFQSYTAGLKQLVEAGVIDGAAAMEMLENFTDDKKGLTL